MRPNGGLVTADGGNIKFSRVGSNILGYFRTQIIFRQRHEVDLDIGMVFFKDLLRQLLHLHHLGVIDGSDSQRRSGR